MALHRFFFSGCDLCQEHAPPDKVLEKKACCQSVNQLVDFVQLVKMFKWAVPFVWQETTPEATTEDKVGPEAAAVETQAAR